MSWKWRMIQNLKRNWLVISKLTWRIWWISTWPLEVSKMCTLMGSFWPKYILFGLKKYREVIFHETEGGYKICRGIDSSFHNWHKEFDKIWPEHSQVSKIFILMGSYWAKYILLELKKNRGKIFHETEEGYKISRGIDSPFQN